MGFGIQWRTVWGPRERPLIACPRSPGLPSPGEARLEEVHRRELDRATDEKGAQAQVSAAMWRAGRDGPQ